MAVKASVQITISKVIDIHACYRYYKLQSSTLAKPSKPTKNPPDGWTDTEPSYVSGSTNTLYFVDCNIYSDMTFSYSEVSVSSSYEAAKAAWNKAKNAENTANDVDEKVGKVLRYDDIKVVLGKTGSNMALILKNDGVNIQKGDSNAASFQSDKLTLGNGFMKLGYNTDTNTTYLTSDVQGNMEIYLPETETEDANAMAGRLRFHSGDMYNSACIESGKAYLIAKSTDEDTDRSKVELSASDVVIKASNSFTYDIPVLEQGDCNKLIQSGKYYLANGSTNRPVDKNGWLESMLYSTDYCHQTYTTYTGEKYTRMMHAGTWDAWYSEPFSIWFTLPAFAANQNQRDVTIDLGRTMPDNYYRTFVSCQSVNVSFSTFVWLDWQIVTKTTSSITIRFWNEKSHAIAATSWALLVHPK